MSAQKYGPVFGQFTLLLQPLVSASGGYAEEQEQTMDNNNSNNEQEQAEEPDHKQQQRNSCNLAAPAATLTRRQSRDRESGRQATVRRPAEQL